MVEFFEEIIFPYLKKVKEEKGFPNEEVTLIIMDTFKGQDNDTMKEPCAVNHCEIVIVPHNLINKFQPLDVSVNKAAKSYISIKYNECLSDQVTSQLLNGRDRPKPRCPPSYEIYACKMDRGSVQFSTERKVNGYSCMEYFILYIVLHDSWLWFSRNNRSCNTC